MRPLFQLGPRLALCAELLRPGRPVCDVGTDHAYLPIWLLKAGRTPRAIASDVNPGPLETAGANARRYGVADRLTLRLSDGLGEIRAWEADDIVIAGMGGDLISRIVSETPWLKDPEKWLVLQPMSSADALRMTLKRLGFALREERAVEDAGRVYSTFSACYVGKVPETGPLYPYLGKLAPAPGPTRRYAEKVLRDLEGRLEGAIRGRGDEEPEPLRAVIEEIRRSYLDGNGTD